VELEVVGVERVVVDQEGEEGEEVLLEDSNFVIIAMFLTLQKPMVLLLSMD
jgi:hypothetical protein